MVNSFQNKSLTLILYCLLIFFLSKCKKWNAWSNKLATNLRFPFAAFFSLLHTPLLHENCAAIENNDLSNYFPFYLINNKQLFMSNFTFCFFILLTKFIRKIDTGIEACKTAIKLATFAIFRMCILLSYSSHSEFWHVLTEQIHVLSLKFLK